MLLMLPVYWLSRCYHAMWVQIVFHGAVLAYGGEVIAAKVKDTITKY